MMPQTVLSLPRSSALFHSVKASLTQKSFMLIMLSGSPRPPTEHTRGKLCLSVRAETAQKR